MYMFKFHRCKRIIPFFVLPYCEYADGRPFLASNRIFLGSFSGGGLGAAREGRAKVAALL